jgi:hypothetical protein
MVTCHQIVLQFNALFQLNNQKNLKVLVQQAAKPKNQTLIKIKL